MQYCRVWLKIKNYSDFRFLQIQGMNFFVQLMFEHLRTRYLDRTVTCTEVILNYNKICLNYVFK